MGKVLWHTVMSLDGFIAGQGDDMDWSPGSAAGPATRRAVVDAAEALLVGRRTQDVEDRLQPGFYGGRFSGPFFVPGTIRPSSRCDRPVHRRRHRGGRPDRR